MNKNITLAVGGVVIAAAFFFGGMKYAESKSPAGAFSRTFTQGAAGSAGARGGNAAFAGRAGAAGGAGGFTVGSILSKDATSITLQIQGGGSKIVFTGASTTISEMKPATLGDLQVGQNVMVTGSANSDGSLTAESIQVRPAGAAGFGGPRGAGTASTTGQAPVMQ